MQIERAKFCEKIKGKWHGEVTETLGGYVQEFEFIDQQNLKVTVMGRTVDGQFNLKVQKVPYEMDIIVEVPEAPTERPPAVPYIVRLVDEDTLDICCPYMSMLRPSSFDGPGLCQLKRGAAEETVDEEFANLSPEEKLIRCAQDLLEIIPNERVSQPEEQDSEMEKAAKVMIQVKFQSGQYQIVKKYGQMTVEQVFNDCDAFSRKPSTGNDPYKKALQDLHQKCWAAGLLDQPADDAPRPQNTEPSPEPPSKSAEVTQAESAQAEATKASSTTSTSASEEKASVDENHSTLKIILGTTIVLGALAAGFASKFIPSDLHA
eukprot:gnl/MRDRNA2_/MRDRNA2_84895_c0_seq3.p1 gnl/MRDRNA2_/MRDRNA2_84895_c0~~gnl/MRDRNA2_/MRDRNA2_84895_c0_seq3.p1  ORF type:complete len:319 (+),score=88.60 gnl/MRDRNA2_/MRDRNA2_84895_c0_seq3:514-1470(+)